MKSAIYSHGYTNSSNSSVLELVGGSHMTKEMSLIAGYYMSAICILGIVENVAVLNTFRRHPNMHFISSYLVRILFIYDILMAICAFPFIITSCIANTWLFSDLGCQWYGFVMTATGLGSIVSLTCIAIERFILITRMENEMVSKAENRMKKVSIASALFGILLALLPFFGVGSYDHEPVFLSCSPAWWGKQDMDVAFVLILFSCAFIIPVCLISCSYVGIFIKVYKVNARTRCNRRYVKLAMLSFLMIVCFLLSWGPYAIFAFLQAFGDGFEVSAMENMIPVMMAKSCILWNPIIYVGGNEKFRNLLKNDICEFLGNIKFILHCKEKRVAQDVSRTVKLSNTVTETKTTMVLIPNKDIKRQSNSQLGSFQEALV